MKKESIQKITVSTRFVKIGFALVGLAFCIMMESGGML